MSPASDIFSTLDILKRIITALRFRHLTNESSATTALLNILPVHKELFHPDSKICKMAPKMKRHSDEEWLSRKTEIRELFLKKGFTLVAVTRHLESQGFYAR